MEIPDHLTCLLRNMHVGHEATVGTEHGTTDWFQTGKGVHQACILSPCLFNLYADCCCCCCHFSRVDSVQPPDGSLPGSPVPGILQARTLEWLPFPSSNMNVKSESEVTQSCLTLRDPMDCGPPGSSFHGIFQARVLEWDAIAFSVCADYMM